MSYRKRIPTDPEGIRKALVKANRKEMIICEHAKRRMLERNITQKEIELVLEYGSVVEEQEHPSPPRTRYQIIGPSQLPYVVVVSVTKGGRLNVVTAAKS